MQKPLIERKKLMKSLSVDQELVHACQYSICTKPEQVLRLFEEQALTKHEEGIIIKDTQSVYLPNDRSQKHWIKLKTDYIDQLGDTLDLLILGGFYGKRQSEESVNTFLVGVLKGKLAVPLCKVG